MKKCIINSVISLGIMFLVGSCITLMLVVESNKEIRMTKNKNMKQKLTDTSVVTNNQTPAPVQLQGLFRNSYVRDKGHPEANDGKSMTVPDMSYTIRELLEKHTKGIMPKIGLDPIYEDEMDFDTDVFNRRPDFDISEISEAQAEINQRKTYNDYVTQTKRFSDTTESHRGSEEGGTTDERPSPVIQVEQTVKK